MKARVVGVAAVAVALLLIGYVLTRPGEAPPPPQPPAESAPPAREPVVEPPPAPEPPPPVPKLAAPEATLVIRAMGGDLPRVINAVIDGKPRELAFPPWAEQRERRAPLPEASAGSRVEVTAEGFAPAEAVVEGPDLEATVELGAFATVVVSGAVKTAQPMSVVVRAAGVEHEATLVLPGRVEVGELVAGTSEIEVRGGPHMPLHRRSIDLDWGERKRVTLTAADLGLRVTGRTVTESGDPVGAAVVSISVPGLTEGFLFARTEVTSDRHGRFALFLPPDLEYEVSARKMEFGSAAARKIRLGTEPPEPWEIEILRGRGVRGIVVDHEGEPIPEALVACIQQFASGAYGQFTTGEDGKFRFDEFPPGKTVTVWSRKEGYAMGLAPPLEVGVETRDVRIVLRPEVPIQVRLVEAGTGEPVTCQLLSASMLRIRDERRQSTISLTTERQGPGRWIVHGYDGESILSLNPTGLKDHRPGRHQFRDIGEDPVIVELVPRGGVVLVGRVLDERGRPVANAKVDAAYRGDQVRQVISGGRYRVWDRTNERGRFRLSGLEPGGRYMVTAIVERDIMSAVVASSGPVWLEPENGMEVELRVWRTGAVRGRVVPKDSATPVQNLGLRILAIHLDTGDRPDPEPGILGMRSQHSIEMDGLRPGHYDLLVSSDHLPLVLRDVVVEAGETTDLGELVVIDGSVVEVILRRPDGTPLPGCYIWALGKEGRHGLSGKTDELGRAEIRRLPPVPVVLLAFFNGLPCTLVGECHPEPRSRSRIAAVAPEPGRLLVRGAVGSVVEVRANQPSPLDRILVDGFSRKPFWSGCQPDPIWDEKEHRIAADGTLEFGPLSPGEYRVKLGAAERTVTVVSGETVEVSFP